MKNLLLCTAVCVLFLLQIYSSAQAQQTYVIKGKIDNLGVPLKIFVLFFDNNKSVTDSAIVEDGNFELRGVISRPMLATIFMTGLNRLASSKSSPVSWLYRRPRQFYIDKGVTTVQGGDLYLAEIHNPVQDEFLEYTNLVKLFERPLEILDAKILKTKQVDSLQKLKLERVNLERQREQKTLGFVKTHPASFVSLDLAKRKSIVIRDVKSFEEMFNSLSTSFRKSPDGVKMSMDLALTKKFGVGEMAKTFTQADTSGKQISLTSLKGKYILIDFWASWCGWCRAEYPYLQQVYKRYGGKNFEIIGVSLDDKRKAWTDAIKQNRFPWIQVCDLKGRENVVAKAYGVSAIPRNFLIDPNGRIIAKDLRRQALVEKMEEIFSSSK